jgi:hypothetical protein
MPTLRTQRESEREIYLHVTQQALWIFAAFSEEHKQNKRTQTSMPRVGFKPTIPVFERPETVHASDRAATAIGEYIYLRYDNLLHRNVSREENTSVKVNHC